MSLLTIILTLAMLLWAVGFVVIGLVLAEGVLWQRPSGASTLSVSRVRKAGALILVALGGVLVAVALVVGGLMADRETHVFGLGAKVSELESRIQGLEKLGRELSEKRP